jgi:2-furoyl-CoA dehydrogenase large subunit
MPRIKYGSIETPSPHSYSGAKGMGEGGGAPLHAISAALQDALWDEGIIIDDSYNNASTLYEQIQKHRGEMKANVRVERE